MYLSKQNLSVDPVLWFGFFFFPVQLCGCFSSESENSKQAHSSQSKIQLLLFDFLGFSLGIKKGNKARVLQNPFSSINQWLQYALLIMVVGDIFILQWSMVLLYFKLEVNFILMTNLCWLEWTQEWGPLYGNAALKIYRKNWKIKR